MITSNNLKNYLTKSTTSVVFFVLSNLMNAQDSTLNTKISELEKEKSKIETEINELKKQQIEYKTELRRLNRLQWDHDHNTIDYGDDR